ncbi:heme exporter protein CcmB [Salmonella enterica subsp. enterica serovar Weltevreden]|nr:heme exporter protein CcmB [Salmonella enterica subsp. enterica serovar Weltevreden]
MARRWRPAGILVLPLSVPVLIFAAAAMDAVSMHLPADGYLAVLGRAGG